MLEYAAKDTSGPIAIRYPRGAIPAGEKPSPAFQPGKAQLIESEGKIALVSCGDTLPLVRAVHAALKEEGIPARLIDLRSVKPLDEDLLRTTAKHCSHIFTFENNVLTGGIGSAITQLLCGTRCKVVNFGYPDSFVPHGSTSELLASIGFTAPDLLQTIQNHIKR